MNEYTIIYALLITWITLSEATSDSCRIPLRGSSNSGWYQKAGVAADSKPCAKVAREILKKKGSVVDAGIAAQLCNAVVDQPHMGIGGGSINLVYASPKTGGPKKLVFLSGDARAPNWVTNMSAYGIDFIPSPYHAVYNHDGTKIEWNKNKGLTVGTPGEIKVFYTIWEEFGLLPWKDIVQPSIDLARHGFPLTPGVENTLYEFSHLVRGESTLTSVFSKPSGVLHSKGETVKDLVLARTLETIATHPLSFYNGKLADDVVQDVREFGGRLTKEDLINYKATYPEAITFPINGGKYTAIVPGQPFSGQLFALAYNVLQGYNTIPSDISTPEGLSLFLHRFLETWKFTLSHANCIGESWNEKPTCKKFVPMLTDPAYASIIRDLIDDDFVQDDPNTYLMMERDPQLNMKGTSHLSIVGDDGSAFLSTSSINSEFGIEVKGKRTGILFNNRLIDFSRLTSLDGVGPDDDANAIGPDKEAASFRVPLLVIDENGNTVLALGASGGSRIVSGMLLDFMMHMHFGMSLKEAIDYPRMVMFPVFPLYNTYYDDFDQDIIDRLLEKQHPSLQPVYPMFLYTCVVQGVSLMQCQQCEGYRCERPCIEAVSDYRKGGGPDGY